MRPLLLLCLLAVLVATVPVAHAHRKEPYGHNWDTADAHLGIVVTAPLAGGTFHGVSSECYRCGGAGMPQLADLSAAPAIVNVTIEAKWPYRFEVRINGSVVSEFRRDIGGHGVYSITFSGAAYQWQTVERPSRFWTPILVVAAVLTALALVYTIGRVAVHYGTPLGERHFAQRGRRPSLSVNTPHDADGPSVHTPLLADSLVPSGDSAHAAAAAAPVPLAAEATTTKPQTAGRLNSLDTFRGISIAVMIFVNYGGGGYWFFDHSPWNGLTWADLVFPWFMFMMGVAMPLSFRSLQRKNTPLHWVLWKIVKRSVLLFWFGLMLNGGYFVTSTGYWRIPGVLQRFAVSYFVVALIIVFIPKLRQLDVKSDTSGDGYDDRSSSSWRASLALFRDFIPYVHEWLVVLTLVAVWLLLTFLVDVPGCGRGYLGPGGLADHGNKQHCTGGAAGYIDRKILGERHIYLSPTCMKLYQTGPYDPEGLLGNLTSIFLCYCGVQCGRVIIFYRDHLGRLKRWIVWGIVLGLLGTALAAGRQNGGPIPINKNMWSLSFVLVMAGTANCVLSLLYVIIDVCKLWDGEPLVYLGMNSLVIYMFSEIAQDIQLFPFFWDAPLTYAAQLAMNVTAVAVWTFVAWWMYMHSFFINV